MTPKYCAIMVERLLESVRDLRSHYKTSVYFPALNTYRTFIQKNWDRVHRQWTMAIDENWKIEQGSGQVIIKISTLEHLDYLLQVPFKFDEQVVYFPFTNAQAFNFLLSSARPEDNPSSWMSSSGWFDHTWTIATELT